MAEILENKGFRTFIEPIFSVEKIAAKNEEIYEQISALIITSANACEAIIDFGFSLEIKIFALGEKTAKKLLEFGFKNIVFSPENSAISLLNLIIETKKDKSGLILYFHGSLISLDFQTELEKFGIKVKKILAYKIIEKENFSADFLQFTQKNLLDHVLLFSQNSAKIFFKLAARHNLLEYFKHPQIACLSEKILRDVQNLGFSNSVKFNQLKNL